MNLRHRHDLSLKRPAVSFGGGTTRESSGNRAYKVCCFLENIRKMIVYFLFTAGDEWNAANYLIKNRRGTTLFCFKRKFSFHQ